MRDAKYRKINMKTNVVIVSLMIAFGQLPQANASDRAFIRYAIDSPQMQRLSKQPYQQPRSADARGDSALKDAGLRGYDLQSRYATKLGAIAKRSY